MVAQPKIPTFTVAEYLALERASDTKHEYLDGYIYAMAGGTPVHSQIGTNATTALNIALRQSPCIVYNSDVRVRLDETRFVYPDAAVSCDERDRAETEEIHYPRLIIEVLSDSTEKDDRGDKFAYYRHGATVEDYLLINHHRVEVERYHRGVDGNWTYHSYGRGENVPIEGLDISCAVDDFYVKVDLIAQ